MAVRVIDSVNDPGDSLSGGGKAASDDRFGFDEGAGTAWVLDGATDVAGIRLFPRATSDAAWYAEALSRRLLDPPSAGEPARAYWTRVLEDVVETAARESEQDLAAAPREAHPSAAGIWLRRTRDVDEIAWLGDCVAVIADGSGARMLGGAEKAARETAGARAYHAAATEADRAEMLRADRRAMNTPGGYPIFSVHPEAVAALKVERAGLASGARALLMSDGLLRLITPLGVYTAETLLAAAVEKGLGALIAELREREHAAALDGDAARVKRSDDAAGLLIVAD